MSAHNFELKLINSNNDDHWLFEIRLDTYNEMRLLEVDKSLFTDEAAVVTKANIYIQMWIRDNDGHLPINANPFQGWSMYS